MAKSFDLKLIPLLDLIKLVPLLEITGPKTTYGWGYYPNLPYEQYLIMHHHDSTAQQYTQPLRQIREARTAEGVAIT